MLGRCSGALLLFCLSMAGAAAAPHSRPAQHIKLLKADTELAADGSDVATFHVEAAADNAAAAMALGQTSVPYVTEYQSLEIIEAYTRKPDGSKIPVDVSAIYDQLPPGASGAPMITDLHVKTIVFPQFAAGDTAVYTARLVTKHPIFPGQYWGGDAFVKQIAFDEVEETLTAPHELPLHVESKDVGFDKSEKNGQTVYRWHYSAPVSPDADISTVHLLNNLPHYTVSTFPDYAALGRAYAQAAAPASAVTPTVKALADKIAKGASDRRAIARALYEWVAGHIRYVAIELGKGSLIPHQADTVLSNGYGDCKDHVTLLAALLRAEGITSEAVLLNAQSDYDLGSVATFAGLNHVITYLPDFDLYLDSTDNVAPFGVLPFQEYGKPAVFASETAPRQGRIPILPAGLAHANTKTVSHLGKDGVITGTTTTTASGPYAIQLRGLGLMIQAAGPEEAAKRLLEMHGLTGNPTGSFEMPSPTEPGDSYSITGTFRSDDWTDEAAGKKAFHLPGGMRLLEVSGEGLIGPFFRNPILKPDDEIPCYNGEESEDISLEAPPDQKFSSVPADTHVKTANIRFDAHWTLTAQTLRVHRSFTSTIDRPLCTAAIRAANADALKTIGDSYEVEISLESSKQSDKQTWYAPDNIDPPRDPKLVAAMTDALSAMNLYHDNAAIAQFSAILARSDLPIQVSYVARYDRAVLYARGGQTDEALTDINAALASTPNDARMLDTRAYVYFTRADFAHSVADCDAALGQYPADPRALRLRANDAMEMSKYQDAIRDLTAELQVMSDPPALLLRAVANHRMGRESEATSDIEHAVSAGENDAKAMYASITQNAAMKREVRDSISSSSSAPGTPASTGAGLVSPTAANDHESYYPPLSALLGEMGRARVGFEIATDGSVHNPEIARSSGFPSLDAAALTSVKTWRYNPARQNGKPVASHYLVNVDWGLR